MSGVRIEREGPVLHVTLA
jgi:methylglutaconyl-CoA hydratase